MRTLLHTEFTALLARADVSQAGFARLTGVTPRQLNNWARGRAAVPKWAALLAAALGEVSPDRLEIMLEAAEFRWHETLGVAPNADATALRQAMTRLAMLYHPDKGGAPEQMSRVNAAYERARHATPNDGMGGNGSGDC
jgi:transcriptional regulator with XRE-family HTH domain